MAVELVVGISQVTYLAARALWRKNYKIDLSDLHIQEQELDQSMSILLIVKDQLSKISTTCKITTPRPTWGQYYKNTTS